MSATSFKKNTLLLILGTLCALALVAYGAFFYTIKMKYKEVATLRDVAATKQGEDTRAVALKNLLAATAPSRAELDSYFVTSSTIVHFIEKLESLGGASGVEVSLTSVDIDKANKNLLRATLTIKGSFENLYHFVALAEAMVYEVELRSVALRKGATASTKEKPFWEGDVVLELLNFLPASQ